MTCIDAAQMSSAGDPATSVVPPRVSVITLGARNLNTLRDFYRRLGWQLAVDLENFAAFETQGAVLTIFPLDAMASDARAVLDKPGRGSGGIVLAIVVSTPAEVDQTIATVRERGGRITKEPVDAEEFEGRDAYFADPEDNLWEVAYLHPDTRMAGAIRHATGVDAHRR